MTEREALKLALEALETLDRVVLATQRAEDAITAIKEALAQPEQEPVAYRSYGAMKNGLTGWRFATDKSTYHDDPNQEPLYTTPQKCKPLTDEQILRANQVIYNGMTCVHIQEDGEPENLLAFARAIEAAHGIYAPPELKE